MLFISKQGHVDAERVIVKIFPAIENGPMEKVNGIVVHQTGGSTANSAFESYKEAGANGAHFLIDKSGVIYQTASLLRGTSHVGKLKSRCVATKACSPEEFKAAYSMRNKYKKLSRREHKKKFPERYPSNFDSVGIELVGKAISGEGEDAIYEPVTSQQNASLEWLVRELSETLGTSMQEVYRHPDLSYKVKSEARTAKWDR
ncbi:peptidoglycan recognition family protein [Cupriavidus sp. WS]|uniref:peptidoglycan recognition protein family protein n=1 Tax=Cupriavidus sp. WS TaxID=1312922 RepID=UPI0009DC0D03|nr:peptidoglycan recognition family protein [Cupriavidus sp. WS]